MTSHPLHDFIRRLRRARSVTEGGHLTDAQLLERFVKQRDEAAFEVLVWRHGTLVLNVARRLLRQDSDAEDVFQATFLTLSRKATSIRRSRSLGSWLYKVAYRLALRAGQAAQYERKQGFVFDCVASPKERGDAELNAVLAEEVNRLPKRCQAVVVLCYLQGATTEEAARVLGCPRGTVLSRLSSARQRLQKRLLRRGIAPTVALAAVSFGEAASAGPSTAIVAGVVAASLSFAAGQVAIPMVSSQAAALAQGALQTMMWTKIKIITVIVCGMAVVGTGSGWLAGSRKTGEASLPAAEPPVKKEGLLAAAPGSKEKIKKEIVLIQKEMADLADQERNWEQNISEMVAEARLQLLELQADMKESGEDLQSERERLWEKRKKIQDEITRQENIMDNIAQNSPDPEASGLKEAIDRRDVLQNRVFQLEGQDKNLRNEIRKRGKERRKSVLQAEEKLHLLEARQARQREDFAAERERAQARLQRLEDKALDLEPSDRLLEVVRKLDALRREVVELRRALEREKPR